MRKSPLSTPGGSRSRYNDEWKFYADTGRTNYSFDGYKRGCISLNDGELNCGNDGYIPLNSGTSDNWKQSGSRHSSGVVRARHHSGSPLFNYNRGSHFANIKQHFNDSYSPYKHTGMQFHGQNKNTYKDGHRQVDISRYFNIESALEDPWAELIQKLDDSKIINKMDVTNGCSGILDLNETKQSISLVDEHFQNIQDNSESKNQPIDVDLRINDNVPNCKTEDSLCIET